ncbi:hypothetical protein ID856_07140 [Xenorhabdus sp. 18]|uniref:hypothetical protein n=1 Tax=Xenorhabdus doucetiae TaxID=351671 RepID=UPI001993AA79|nr:hypothetical protein [Xenorhabdus sp. 18]MBD2796314.1 hypothetical protein [Xenorhabdus sp. 18]
MKTYINNKFIRLLPYIGFLFLLLISMHVSAAINLGEIEVTSTSQDLYGDGKQAYAYRAKVTDAASGKAIPHLSFDEDKVIWSVVDASDNNYAYDKLQEEGKLFFGDQSLNTDKDGYLTAKLASFVGVKNVKVKLEVVTEDDKQENMADTAVNFIPQDQPAGLYVYSFYGEEVNGKWDIPYDAGISGVDAFFTESQQEPNNRIDSILGEIRLKKEEPLFTYGTETASSEVLSGSNAIYQYGVEGKKFKISIIAWEEPSKIRTTVTNIHTGAMAAYTYTMNMQRSFIAIPNSTDTGANRVCEKQAIDTANNIKYKSVMLTDLWTEPGTPPSQIKPLLREYPNLRDWPQLNGTGLSPEQVVKVIDNRNGGTSYVGFSLKDLSTKSTTDSDTLLCTQEGI